MKTNIGEYLGHVMYLEGLVSYSCPSLKLYGYATERSLKNAMRKKLAHKLSIFD